MLENATAFSGYSVDNISNAKEFYEKLGVDTRQTAMGLELHFQGRNPVFVYEKSDHQPASFTVLNFEVNDIDVAIDGLVEKGIVFERYDTLPAAQDERGVLRGKAASMGPDIAWFKDPAGNILSIVSN